MKKLFVFMMCAVAALSACTEEIPVTQDHEIIIELRQPLFDTLAVTYCNLEGASQDALKSLSSVMEGIDLCLFKVSDKLPEASVWGHSVLVSCSSSEHTFVATASEAYVSTVLTYSLSSAVVISVLGTNFLLGDLGADGVQALLDATIHVDESADWIYHLGGAPDTEALYKAGFSSCWDNTIYAGSGMLSNISGIEQIPVDGLCNMVVKYVYYGEVL